MTERKRVYIVERTITERFYYNPEEIRLSFGDALDAHEGSFDDFVIETFEQIEGCQMGDKFFYHDASPDVGIELIERWDDE